MGIEEVRIGASLRILACLRVVGQQMQHVLDDLESMVAVEHTCPEVGFPSQTPACSLVATLVQRVSGSCEQVGVTVG